MKRVRVRQHVNPLSSKYQQSVTFPDWNSVYANLDLPLHLDIGCGRGRFLWQVAQIESNWNFLGLEIREPLVIEANSWRDESALSNLHYLFCNVNISLPGLLVSLPEGILKRVSILFPDPWFKNRHKRRRVVQPELVAELAKYMPAGGEVFLHSDVLEVAEEMRDRFSENPFFNPQYSDDWLSENLLPVCSERERSTLSRNEPVYRTVFVRGNG
ncbi:MAG: tRNA (guanosine(46)-N7)-methyltransferase TrmB [Cyanobacteriota bacterium]|nr:tRNA (guanosine(46)-N7)-methyltransferase TrmB [Cyanobacteriota bacterium]